MKLPARRPAGDEVSEFHFEAENSHRFATVVSSFSLAPPPLLTSLPRMFFPRGGGSVGFSIHVRFNYCSFPLFSRSFLL